MKQVIVMLLAISISSLAGMYSGGSGTKADPYQISDPNDWLELAETSTDWSAHFVIITDIDFQGMTLTPIGDATLKYSGEFDGNGRTIKNFVIANSPDTRNGTAIFRRLGATAVIKNLTIQNGSVTGLSPYLGYSSYTAILGAECTYGALIDHVTCVDCNVSITHNIANSPAYCGMIAGANHGAVKNCQVIRGSVKGDITAGSYMDVGGIVGYQTGNSVVETGLCQNSYSSAWVGDMSGKSTIRANVGGISGRVSTSDVDNCGFKGTIWYTGGGGGHPIISEALLVL